MKNTLIYSKDKLVMEAIFIKTSTRVKPKVLARMVIFFPQWISILGLGCM